MAFTWLGGAALLILALACAIGYSRGFMKEIVAAFFTIISFLIIWSFNPYVNEFIKTKTPVYEKIQNHCQEIVRNKIGEEILDRKGQEEAVDSLFLPKNLKEDLLKNNRAEVYKRLAVNTFADYAADYLAVTAVNLISFLISFLFVTAAVKLILAAFHILTMLPVLHGANKLAGALVAGAKCIVFFWVALLVLMLLCGTEAGRKGMELVEQDVFLGFLNQHNLFLKIFAGIFYGHAV